MGNKAVTDKIHVIGGGLAGQRSPQGRPLSEGRRRKRREGGGVLVLRGERKEPGGLQEGTVNVRREVRTELRPG